VWWPRLENGDGRGCLEAAYEAALDRSQKAPVSNPCNKESDARDTCKTPQNGIVLVFNFRSGCELPRLAASCASLKLRMQGVVKPPQGCNGSERCTSSIQDGCVTSACVCPESDQQYPRGKWHGFCSGAGGLYGLNPTIWNSQSRGEIGPKRETHPCHGKLANSVGFILQKMSILSWDHLGWWFPTQHYCAIIKKEFSHCDRRWKLQTISTTRARVVRYNNLCLTRITLYQVKPLNYQC
jgi:hypothetical protein